MEQNWQQRTELLLGKEGINRLTQAHVLVVGVGGVGAYAAEMVVRAGVGTLTIVDADIVQPSNINRQLPALHSTIGKTKCQVMAQRLVAINPKLKIFTVNEFITQESIPSLLSAHAYDFVIDAIDTIAPKCELIRECIKRKLKIISSMGAGAKKDITKVQFATIWDTYHCGLSKAVRKRLQKFGIRYKLPVVFSSEQANPHAVELVEEKNKKSTCGTISYLPATFGCYLASYVIQKLIQV